METTKIINEMPLYKTQLLDSLSYSQHEAKGSSSNEFKETKHKPNLEIGLLTKTTACNDIWNSTKYQNKDWKDIIYTSFYQDKYNIKEFELNEKVNPEVVNKKFNMRKTTISEYSNALHNNRVFVNPKFTSC